MTAIEKRYLSLILIIYIAACIETDIFLPAFPDMMKYFKTSSQMIQSLLTWNFLGICISGPFYGPLSDAFGRRRPLIFALGIFASGSLFTLLSDDLNWMLFGRILQGLGGGGCFTLGTTIIFDIFQRERAAIAVNKLSTIIPLVMAGAPLVGGYLNRVYGFRSNFLTITVFAFTSFFVSFFFLKESLAEEKRSKFNLRKIGSDFKLVLSNTSFLKLACAVSLLFSAYLSFVSTSSIFYVEELGVSSKMFPAFQGTLLLSYVFGSLSCSKALEIMGRKKLKKTGLSLASFGIFSFVVVSLLFPRNPVFMTFFMAFYSFGCSWVMNSYFTEAMGIVPEIRGVSASLLTSSRLMFTGISVGVVGYFYDKSKDIFPVMVAVLCFLLTALFFLNSYEKGEKGEQSL